MREHRNARAHVRALAVAAALAVPVSGGLAVAMSTAASAQVEDAPGFHGSPNLTATEGEAFDGHLGEVRDVTGNALQSVTLDWGDGTAPVPGVSNGLAVFGDHTYKEAGTYTVKVTAVISDCVVPGLCITIDPVGPINGIFTATPKDVSGPTPLSGTATITVHEADTSLSGEDPIYTQSGALNAVVANGSDANASSDYFADYATSIDFGDGSAPATCAASATNPCITPGADGYTVNGVHQYTKPGVYRVVISVTDGGTPVDDPALTLVVVPVIANLTATAEGTSFSGTVGSVLNNNRDVASVGRQRTTFESIPTVGSVSIDWGDDSASSTGEISSGGAVSGSHTYAEEGTYTITLSATPAATPEVSAKTVPWTATSTVSVADAPINGTVASGNPFGATAGSSFSSLLGHVVDTDATAPASDLSATVDWGDGVSSALPLVAATGGGDNVSGSHTYATPGTKNGVIHFVDRGGAKSDVPFAVNVVAATTTTNLPITTTSSPTSGVQGIISTPNTGADLPIATALLLVASGGSLVAVGRRRRA